MAPDDLLLRTQQVARALGVSVRTVKRWVDGGILSTTRTAGKHRLIPRPEAVRLAQRLKTPLAGQEARVGTDARVVQGIDDRIRNGLAQALQAGDAPRAAGLIRGVVASGPGAVALADQWISPVMERIGDGWEVGELDVFPEHQASPIVTAALTGRIDGAARRRDPQVPLAVGATPEGDYYQIALLRGELVLRELGWDLRNLSVNLPMRSLIQAVRECRSRLVYLSVNQLVDEDRFPRECRVFGQAAAARGTVVVLGGRARGPGLRDRLGHARSGERMVNLSEFARQLGPVATLAGAAPSSTASRSNGSGTPRD